MKEVKVGSLGIGGDNPIRVQSMCNTATKDVAATVAQIKQLEAAGCELVRVAVPDMESTQALAEIKEQINIPLIADVHFDAELALAAIPHVDKLRINPGTMPRLKEVLEAAKGLPIRIGINAASLEKGLTGTKVEQMIASVEANIKLMEDLGFENIIVALKSSDVKQTIEAYRQFAKNHDYPLHLGLTEAGEGKEGIIRSAVAMGVLLEEGIGDTIRVSLTGNPVQEVEAAYEILNALGLRDKPGATVISCPTCARASVNLEPIVKQIKAKLPHHPIKVAVMGCEVNGPGEARDAHIGLAFSHSKGFIFKQGKVIKEVKKDEAVQELLKLINS